MLGAERRFLPDSREEVTAAEAVTVGWQGRATLPISAASDIIGRLGMILPSNRDAVRRDPDAA